MPYDDPDPTDPMTFHAVEVETDDPDAMRDMAECFIEEYVRLGFSAERIVELFRDGRFAGPALAMRRLGGDVVARIIQEHIQIRGPRIAHRSVDRGPAGTIELPVLD